MTIFGLALTLLAISCARDEKSPAAQNRCDLARTKAFTGQQTWLESLPQVLKFSFEKKPWDGVIARPVCVNEKANVKDWDVLVKKERGFPNKETIRVEYTHSVRQFRNQSPYAKHMYVSLERPEGAREWTGTANLVANRFTIVGLIMDGLLDFVHSLLESADPQPGFKIPSCTPKLLAKVNAAPAPDVAGCPQ